MNMKISTFLSNIFSNDYSFLTKALERSSFVTETFKIKQINIMKCFGLNLKKFILFCRKAKYQ